ncbi:hypothetical protein J6590_001168 [Homalodisca vitripennis]|nr:hypothetical protein J6590_001168 [Homalodisca vitripennis]
MVSIDLYWRNNNQCEIRSGRCTKTLHKPGSENTLAIILLSVAEQRQSYTWKVTRTTNLASYSAAQSHPPENLSDKHSTASAEGLATSQETMEGLRFVQGCVTHSRSICLNPTEEISCNCNCGNDCNRAVPCRRYCHLFFQIPKPLNARIRISIGPHTF